MKNLTKGSSGFAGQASEPLNQMLERRFAQGWKNEYINRNIFENIVIFRQKKKEQKLKIILLVVMIILSSCASVSNLPPGSFDRKFDSDIWKRLLVNKESVILESDERQKMIGDLVENIIYGKTKDQLIELLGSSDYEKFNIEESHLIYITGPERSHVSIDGEWLIIYFDENNVCKKYILMTD